MKNLSAPKLLRMALTGAHISYCPHANDKTPGNECLCWKHEVRKWDTRVKLAATTRVRKPKPQKIHLVGHHCSAKSLQGLKTSSDVTEITCQQCLKFTNRPVKTPKIPRISKKKSPSVTYLYNTLPVNP